MSARPLAPFLVGAMLAGCAAPPSYYLQAVGGQIELLRLSAPISELARDTSTPQRLRERLLAAMEIREFASRELGLPDNGSYRKYADVGRPYVVWNVFAAEEFSVRPKEWCFPVAGCVAYRGYFGHRAAEAYAAELRDAGYEVYVGGVPAYSTLGWFDDPLLSTFIHYPEPELARLIFHELAHQVAYARDDTEFNEAFATAVELAGTARWLARRGDERLRAAFEASQARRRDFLELVRTHREALDGLYRSELAPEDKRRRKRALFDELAGAYASLKNGRWNGYAGYDRWFGTAPNNAALASIGIYTRLVPAFSSLLAEEGGDLPRFYARVRQLAALGLAERHALLEKRFDPGSTRVQAGGSW